MKRAAHSFAAVLGLFCCLIAFAAPPATAPATAPMPPSSLYAFGSGDSYWITLSDKLPGSTEITTIAFQRTPGGQWRPIAQLAGQVVSLGQYRSDLVAVMEGGSWRTVYQGGSTAGLQPPDDGKVIGLAGDGDILWGIVRTGNRLQLQSMNQGQWSVTADLPAAAQQGNDALVALGIVDRRVILAVRTPERRVAVFALQGKDWQPMGVIAPKEQIAELEVLALGRRVGVWVSPGHSSGGAVYANPPEWAERIDLGPDPGEAAVASERLRLIYAGKENGQQKAMEKQWDFSGKPLGSQPVNLPQSNFPGPLIRYVTWAVVLLLLALYFLRRRPPNGQENADNGE
jgi:hypothetical protein